MANGKLSPNIIKLLKKNTEDLQAQEWVTQKRYRKC